MQQLLFFVDGIADRELFLVSNRPLHEFAYTQTRPPLSPWLSPKAIIKFARAKEVRECEGEKTSAFEMVSLPHKAKLFSEIKIICSYNLLSFGGRYAYSLFG